MPNLHSHAFQRAMAGLAEYGGAGPDDFWTWREAMYRVALSVTPDDVEAIAAELYVEMLETGFTRVGEFHYLHHDIDGAPYADIAEMAQRILAAAAETGIGMTLLPVFYAHSDFGGAPPNTGQRRFISDLDGFSKLFAASSIAASNVDGANVGVAPHSLRAVTPAELATTRKKSHQTRRSTSTPRSRRRRSMPRSRSLGSGRSNGCFRTRMSGRAGA